MPGKRQQVFTFGGHRERPVAPSARETNHSYEARAYQLGGIVFSSVGRKQCRLNLVLFGFLDDVDFSTIGGDRFVTTGTLDLADALEGKVPPPIRVAIDFC